MLKGFYQQKPYKLELKEIKTMQRVQSLVWAGADTLAQWVRQCLGCPLPKPQGVEDQILTPFLSQTPC